MEKLRLQVKFGCFDKEREVTVSQPRPRASLSFSSAMLKADKTLVTRFAWKDSTLQTEQ